MSVALANSAKEYSCKRGLKGSFPHAARSIFSVITGVSGSGKSSLAFDTLHAEGQRLLCIVFENGQEIFVSRHNACPYCDRVFFDVNISLFSFNSPDGMCPDCNGLGVKLEVDPELIITNPKLSLLDRASLWHGNLRQKNISADWIIDLGPEGGNKGGYIIAQGKPEEISEAKNSYTGKYLAEYSH